MLNNMVCLCNRFTEVARDCVIVTHSWNWGVSCRGFCVYRSGLDIIHRKYVATGGGGRHDHSAHTMAMILLISSLLNWLFLIDYLIGEHFAAQNS